MKSFFSKLFQKTPPTKKIRSSIDPSDLISKVPGAPTFDQLKVILFSRVCQLPPEKQKSAFDAMPPAKQKALLLQVKRELFTARYRCSAGGRCCALAEGAERAKECRYPSCFAMRPIAKGAEIVSYRLAFESSPSITEDEELEKVEIMLSKYDDIQGAIDTLQKYCEERAKVFEGNFVAMSENLVHQLVMMVMWRSSLLMSIGEDMRAVGSLINLASKPVSHNHRLALFNVAATWSAYNDMEVLYYRSLLTVCEEFPLAKAKAEKEFLLKKILVSARKIRCKELYDGPTLHGAPVVTPLVGHIARTFFAHHIGSVLVSAQNALLGDVTEDPLKFPFHRAVLHYLYDSDVEFWQRYLECLVMPPISAEKHTNIEVEAEEKGPTAATDTRRATPPHILDAMGRSMLLHQLAFVLHHNAKEVNNAEAEGSDNITKHPNVSLAHISQRLEGITDTIAQYEREKI